MEELYKYNLQELLLKMTPIQFKLGSMVTSLITDIEKNISDKFTKFIDANDDITIDDIISAKFSLLAVILSKECSIIEKTTNLKKDYLIEKFLRQLKLSIDLDEKRLKDFTQFLLN